MNLSLTRFGKATLLFLMLIASARSEVTVFDDTFGQGSTINSAPTSPAEPSARATAYQQLSAKSYNPNPPTVTEDQLRYGIVATSSGFNHIQALFTKYPVELADTGDFLELAVTFSTESGILTPQTNSTVFFGMYDASQVQPIPGGLAGTVAGATAGYAAGWKGYVANFNYTGGTNRITARPVKGDAVNNNQDVLYNYGGGTSLGSQTSTLEAFVPGASYTEVLRITRSGATNVSIVSTLYSGTSASGTPLYSQSAEDANLLVATFDAFAIGYRSTASQVSAMQVHSVKIVTSATTTIVPVILTEPFSQTRSAGESITLEVEATGGGAALSYQWFKDGDAISGATATTYPIASAALSDSGDYTVTVTNIAGTTTSATATLTITNGAIAPSFLANPDDASVSVGGSHTFTSNSIGSEPLTLQWQFSDDGGDSYANISGATESSYTVVNAQPAAAGYYRVVASNGLGTVYSEAGALTVAPALVSSPVATVVPLGGAFTISVVADAGSGSPEPLTYVWKRDGVEVADGGNVSGAATADLAVASFSAAEAGYYSVTVSNSAGYVTTDAVYVGVPSVQSVSFAPANDATGLAIDQQLRIVFPSPPKIGSTGALRVHDAADDAVVATIDASQFLTYAPGNASAIIPNAAIRSAQGGGGSGTSSYYYMPIAIYGNEVWITLSPTQRLAYGHTYYVTMDPALLLDSDNAVFAGISDSSSWRFSTKAAGPATPTASTGPTTITVGQDGAGDFATFQGAFDWIPQNNTLARTVVVKPGIYRDNATLAQNRNFVTIIGEGANRTDAQLIYPFAYFAPPGNVFTAGSLRIESSDITVRNLTVDNIIYEEYRPNGWPTSGSAAFAGAINTVATTGKRIVFDNVLIKGGQDTIYDIEGIAYYYNCEVWGSVDFIYGKALAVFDKCRIVQIRGVGGPITAPNTLAEQPYGFVFLDCVFPRALKADGYPYDVNVGSTTFQRPWRQDGATAIINGQLDSHFSVKGWAEWDGRENTCRAIEYGSALIGGGAAATPEQRRAAGAYWLNTADPDYTSFSMSPTDPLLAAPGGISNRVAVEVDPADYTLAAIFGHAYFAADLSGWTPSVGPAITLNPASQTVDLGATVVFEVAAVGQLSLSYQWRKDGQNIDGATSATYTIESVAGEDVGNYDCVVSNSNGSATSAPAALAVQSKFGAWLQGFGLDPLAAGIGAIDSDKDGTPNLMEFILGRDPTVPESGFMPQISIEKIEDVEYLVLDYQRATAAADYEAIVETSLDLVQWTPQTMEATGLGPDAPLGGAQFLKLSDTELESIRVAVPFTADRLYIRLNVQE